MGEIAELPDNLQYDVQQELAQGERVQWVEQPIPTFFTQESKQKLVLAIFALGFGVVWASTGWGVKAQDIKENVSLFLLGGFIPIAVGVALLFSPLWARRKAYRTAYVITDQRAITIERGRQKTVRNFPPEQIRKMVRKDRKDGTGDIVFDRIVSPVGEQLQARDVGFLHVRDVRMTEKMLRKLVEKSAGI